MSVIYLEERDSHAVWWNLLQRFELQGACVQLFTRAARWCSIARDTHGRSCALDSRTYIKISSPQIHLNFFGVNTTFTYSLCSVKMFPHGVVDLQTSLQSGQKMKVALCSSGWFTYSAGSTVYETETHKSWRENFDMRARRIFLESTFSTTAWFKERRALWG